MAPDTSHVPGFLARCLSTEPMIEFFGLKLKGALAFTVKRQTALLSLQT